MCKKICFYLVFVILFSLLYYNFSYAEPVKINISLPQGTVLSPGNKIIIPVNISNFSQDLNIRGYALRLNYDENIFQNPELIVTGTLSAGKNVKLVFPKDNIGKCSVSLFEKFEFSENNILIKIQFTVGNNYIPNSKSFISFVSPNQKTVLFNTRLESINTIFIPPAGDINNDSMITLSDAIAALKILIEDYPVIIDLDSDVDFDGKIGIGEAIYILQYISGK